MQLTTDKALIKDCIPLSYLPRGFDYYGGGHIHKRMEGNMGESKIVYPGPIFGSTFEDLEQTAKGERRGFYIITFDKKLTGYEFIEIKVADIISREASSRRHVSFGAGPHPYGGYLFNRC